MTIEELVEHAKRLIGQLEKIQEANEGPYNPRAPRIEGLQAQVTEFLKNAAGAKSRFAKVAEELEGADGYTAGGLISILEAFIDNLEAGLAAGLSPERKGQLDVVSDLLQQAASLLDDDHIHPAAPAVLIGATLEEFLRTWVEDAGLNLGSRKPGLSNYALVLREADLIQKQDVKDLESWGGLRNHAAHGEWEQVSDRDRVRLMLEGVNLFLRKYSPQTRVAA